ncbi:hypothetical protein [Deinococcus yavapaiensis]|uniref:Uncharacterized protein n=1 Tax=Deinococcus yavapaiensis KR-236 TaxID=694435 RepID=A0A318S678_9DEIO|nr:hypothetical protein [Deinococcus yavapaiensis]PYE54173.1 hypothetical protein DES52_106138 [Deinococcus yavapaiensis KR-236]
MKRFLISVLSCALASFAMAQNVNENDNLRGVKVCIDDASFTAGIGALGATSQTLAQGLYDYFVNRMKAEKIDFLENGTKDCVDFIVNLDFGATTGTPRAWYGELSVEDDGAYASLDAKDKYRLPVTIWSNSYYGVLTDNVGLADFLLTQGKTIIDEFVKAYKSAN